ncbi:MAG: adenine phosphoribosyltransferase [Bergeyella sp.]|nr:adenine phosphoribosyltransferase [Bergeyella sp.]
MVSEDLYSRLNETIVSVPDFPKKGVLFRDISPIFLYPKLYKEIVDAFVRFSRGHVDVVCGIESRGYLFGISIAQALGVPFILIRKKGKLPPPILSEQYELEYGFSEIEMKKDQLKKDLRVLIHDDLLATGGTTEAAARLVEKQGSRVTQFSFLIELEFLQGEKKLQPFGAEVFKILKY